MAIKTKDMYLGAAINRIVSSTTFTQVNRTSNSKDLYAVNDGSVLFHVSTRDGKKWNFVVTRDDLDSDSLFGHFIAFVCGPTGVVALEAGLIQSMVSRNARNIYVEISMIGRGKYALSVAGKKVDREFLDAEFPNSLFGISSEVQDRVFCWPLLSKISLFDGDKDRFVETYDRLLDLADRLGFLDLPTAYIGISTIAPDWKVWDEEKLKIVEDQIAYDLEFDGFEISVTRESEPTKADNLSGGMPCTEEFVWRIDFLSSAHEEEDD